MTKSEKNWLIVGLVVLLAVVAYVVFVERVRIQQKKDANLFPQVEVFPSR